MERPGPTPHVTVQVGGLPAPAVGAHGREIPAGVPAQLTLALAGSLPNTRRCRQGALARCDGAGGGAGPPNAATICSTLWPGRLRQVVGMDAALVGAMPAP